MLVSDQLPALTASEIGSFTFCPQAWYLQRCRVSLTAAAELRRQAGSRMHREIGRQTDLVRAGGVAQRLPIIGIAAILVVLLLLMLRGAL